MADTYREGTTIYKPCPECDGRGRFAIGETAEGGFDPCENCGGVGRKVVMEKAPDVELEKPPEEEGDG